DDPYSCYVSTLIFEDGSRLDRYGQITAPVEIGQGERPLRLANGEPNISGDWAQEQRVMTDPRGQRGTLVPLSEAEKYADDPEAAGVIGGARGTEQAAIRAEALRLVQEGEFESAAEDEAALQAANEQGGGRGGFGFGGGANLTEAGEAALDAMEVRDRYAMSCVFTSIVTEWSGDSGEDVDRIVQRGDTITIQYGGLGVEETISRNRSEHRAGSEPSVTGHSIGRWEVDTLIVDTIGIQARLYNARTPHSDQLHVVEELTFDTDARQLRRSF